LLFNTKNFGEIEYDEKEVITFPSGLPGFTDSHRFVMISESNPPDVFYWMQCVDDGDVAFTLMDVYRVMNDYDPKVEPEELAELGDISGDPLDVYNVVVVPEDPKEMRVNLKAPVVVNNITGKAKQVILENENYPLRFMIIKEMEKANKVPAGR
jgi:flagellar assembly factor FliW